MAEQRPPPPPPPRAPMNSVSPLASFIRWLQLKNYQYEVTFSLYMLTYTEKIVFNSILFILVSLLVTAAFFYLPNHLLVIYTRVWYYISGEFAHAEHSGNGLGVLDSIVELVKTSKEVVVSQTAAGIVARETVGRAGQGVADGVVGEL